MYVSNNEMYVSKHEMAVSKYETEIFVGCEELWTMVSTLFMAVRIMVGWCARSFLNTLLR